MKKIKVYLKMILKFILALISVVGVSVLGNLLKDIIPFRDVLLVIVMVLLIANVVSNFIINIKDLSKIKKKKSGEQLIDLLLKTKEEALELLGKEELELSYKYEKLLKVLPEFVTVVE